MDTSGVRMTQCMHRPRNVCAAKPCTVQPCTDVYALPCLSVSVALGLHFTECFIISLLCSDCICFDVVSTHCGVKRAYISKAAAGFSACVAETTLHNGMLYMRESPSDVSNHDVTLVLCRVDMKANQHACAALERASVVLHISAVYPVLLTIYRTLSLLKSATVKLESQL
eukprot:2564-Heterococcus_DN1.PRE.2